MKLGVLGLVAHHPKMTHEELTEATPLTYTHTLAEVKGTHWGRG